MFEGSGLTTFEIAGGSASILGLAIMLFRYAFKIRRSLQQIHREVLEEVERQVIEMQAVGTSVSARTDVGFFALIGLSSLQDSIAFYRDYRLLCILMILVILATGIFVAIMPSVPDYPINLIHVAAMFSEIVFGMVFIMLHVLVMWHEKYLDLYRLHITKIWERPLQKRANPPKDQ